MNNQENQQPQNKSTDKSRNNQENNQYKFKKDQRHGFGPKRWCHCIVVAVAGLGVRLMMAGPMTSLLAVAGFAFVVVFCTMCFFLFCFSYDRKIPKQIRKHQQPIKNKSTKYQEKKKTTTTNQEPIINKSRTHQ